MADLPAWVRSPRIVRFRRGAVASAGLAAGLSGLAARVGEWILFSHETCKRAVRADSSGWGRGARPGVPATVLAGRRIRPAPWCPCLLPMTADKVDRTAFPKRTQPAINDRSCGRSRARGQAIPQSWTAGADGLGWRIMSLASSSRGADDG